MAEKADLLLSLRDQPRLTGTRTEHAFDWIAPEGWNTEVLTLPAGTVVPLEVAVTSVDHGVYVELRTAVNLVGQCVRCLDDLVVEVEVDAAELYTQVASSDRSRARKSDAFASDIEIEGDEFDPAYLIEQDAVDLEPMLRDAIFAEAPMQPVCEEDCEGICEHCGVPRRDLPEDHHHEFIDPRFAALKSLLAQDNG